MAGMSTTTPGMQQAEQHLASTQTTAKNGVRRVEQNLAVLRASWTGEASGKFDESMNAWFADCSVITLKLGEMIQVMRGNRQAITSGEAQNVNVASSIPVGPGLQGL